MIYVRNNNMFSDVKKFDPIENTIIPMDTEEELPDKVSGFFSKFGGILVVLYRQENLYLSVKGKICFFPNIKIETKDVHRTIQREFVVKQVRHIIITDRQGGVILSTNYDEICDTFIDDPTPLIEDEDFDFGLFLEKVSCDVERQKRLFI